MSISITKHSALLAVGLCALAMSAPAATITWTGLGDDISLFRTDNWDNPGGIIETNNFRGVAVPHDFVVTNDTAAVGGAGGVNGTLDLGGTGSLTVTNNATLKLGSGAVIKDGAVWVSNASSFGYIQGTLDNADFVSNWGISLTGPMHLDNGSTFEATWFSGGNGVSSLDGGSTLTIREDAPGTFNNNTVNFLDVNSKIVYSNTNRTIEDVENEHLSKFSVNGEAAIVGTNVHLFADSGTGYTSVRAIHGIVSTNKLLDDPTWATDPIGSPGQDQWRWEDPGITWETTPANDGSVQDQFDAGSVTLTNRYGITGHPEYDINTARLTAIGADWEAADFAYAATANYDPNHVIEAWYTVVITTGARTYTGTSGVGKIHDGPTRLPSGNNGMLQDNLAAAWNAPLTWNINPFSGGGIGLNSIVSIDVDFHADTSADNLNAGGSSWFTMSDSGLTCTVDLSEYFPPGYIMIIR